MQTICRRTARRAAAGAARLSSQPAASLQRTNAFSHSANLNAAIASDSAPSAPSPSPSHSASPSTDSVESSSSSLDLNDKSTDWSRSFQGLGSTAFSDAACAVLLAPIDEMDVEIKPDGILYLPEIKYRRILNKAFKPGGWGLAPRSDATVDAKNKLVSQTFGLIAEGRCVASNRCLYETVLICQLTVTGSYRLRGERTTYLTHRASRLRWKQPNQTR